MDVKSLTRGNWKAVISRNMKDPVKQQYIIECVGRVLKYELQRFCSDSVPSILRSNSIEHIKDFQWAQVIDEAKERMPVLLRVLKKCTETPTQRENENAIIGLIISLLAKLRRPQASLFQKVVSLILYSGHCSKRVRLVIYRYNVHVHI